MPNFTYTHRATIESSLEPDNAGAAVASFTAKLGRAPGSNDRPSVGTGRIGSRAAYRMWGAWRWLPGWKKMPMVLSWEAQPATNGSTVMLQMTSDQGRYLFMTPIGTEGYQARFGELEVELREMLR